MGWLVDSLLKHLQTTPLTKEGARGLYDAVDEIAKELKIKSPTIHLVPEISHPHPILNALSLAPNAASLSRDTIIITKPMLRLLESENLKGPISEELKGIIAHEMHHCANRRSMMMMSRFPVLAVPAAALIATYLYDRAHAKAKKEGNESKENIAGHIESSAKEMKETLPEDIQQSGFLNSLLHYGKYVAVAVVGVGGGLWLARYGGRYHEFAADKFGASVLKHKESMVSALRKVHEAAGLSISEHPETHKFQGIIAETILAHPSFAERAAHIRS